MLVVLLGKTTLKKKNRKNLRAFLSCGDCFKNKELLAYKEKSDEKSWLLQKAPTQLYSNKKYAHQNACSRPACRDHSCLQFRKTKFLFKEKIPLMKTVSKSLSEFLLKLLFPV